MRDAVGGGFWQPKTNFMTNLTNKSPGNGSKALYMTGNTKPLHAITSGGICQPVTTIAVSCSTIC